MCHFYILKRCCGHDIIHKQSDDPFGTNVLMSGVASLFVWIFWKDVIETRPLSDNLRKFPLTWGMKPHIRGIRSPRCGGNSGIYFYRRNCWADSSDIAAPSAPAVIYAEGDDGKKIHLVVTISMTFGVIDAKISDFFIYLHPENPFRRQYETYI